MPRRYVPDNPYSIIYSCVHISALSLVQCSASERSVHLYVSNFTCTTCTTHSHESCVFVRVHYYFLTTTLRHKEEQKSVCLHPSRLQSAAHFDKSNEITTHKKKHAHNLCSMLRGASHGVWHINMAVKVYKLWRIYTRGTTNICICMLCGVYNARTSPLACTLANARIICGAIIHNEHTCRRLHAPAQRARL